MSRKPKEANVYMKAALQLLWKFEATPAEGATSYSYQVQTQAGLLLVSIDQDCSITARFEDVERAKTLDLGDRFNPFSGKWNWMGGADHAGDMYDLAQFQQALRKIK